MSCAMLWAVDSQVAERTFSFTVSMLPISMRAARWASWGLRPRWTFSWAEACWKAMSSSSMSWLRCCLWKRALIPLMRFCRRGMGSPSGFEDAGDGGELAAPLVGFFFEGLSATVGEEVVLGSAIVFGGSPFGLDAGCALEAGEG